MAECASIAIRGNAWHRNPKAVSFIGWLKGRLDQRE
jgi:hypothetical protein